MKDVILKTMHYYYISMENYLYSKKITKNIMKGMLSHEKEINGNVITIPPKSDSIEVDEMRHFVSDFKNKGCIWDVGANIGTFSINMSKHFDNIISFEPNEANIEYLKENVERNEINDIKVMKYALGRENEEREMYMDIRPGSGISSLGKDERLRDKIKVEVRTVDYLINKIGKPDVIKLDVEGAEANVLRGAKKSIEYENIEWLIEVHSKRTGKRRNRLRQNGDDAESLYNILTNNDYNIYGNREGKYFEVDIEENNIPLYWYATKRDVI